MVYLDTCIISGLAKGDLKPEEKYAMKEILLSSQMLCTSKEAEKEIKKIPKEEYKTEHLRIYSLVLKITHENCLEIYSKLSEVLKDKQDIDHICQAEANKIKYFLTTDYKTILNKKCELEKILNIKFFSPVEFNSYLDALDNP